MAEESNLFKEVNNLRKGNVKEVNQEDIDRAKRNDTVFAHISGHRFFEWLTLSFIVANAIFIGYDADYSARETKPDNLYDKEMPAQFIIFENAFAVYFTFEVVIRFLAFRKKSDALCDYWFLFDSVLVFFMVLETWIIALMGGGGALSQLSILRLLRLLRITRMAKLMRFFPELQIIVKGMLAAVRSVVCTAILLILVLYVWAILFTSEYHQGNKLDDDEDLSQAEQYFGSMGKSMRHLFIMGTILDDITACTNAIRGSKKTLMLIFFIIFVLISSFTMLNMLIGILCEVVCATGEGERLKNQQDKAHEAIETLFKKMDKDDNGEISREEFLSMKNHKKVMDALKDLEIKAKHFEMYADLMFKPEEEGGELPTMDFEKAFNMIMRLRPGTKVSALDFASFQMTVYKNHDSLRHHMGGIEKMASILSGQEIASPPSPGAAQAPSKLTVSTVPQLEKTSDQEILAELQRRLGSKAISYNGAAVLPPPENTMPKMLVEEVSQDTRTSAPAALQNFATNVPGGILDEEAWSKETYTC
jgi:voltage-gated sodium channel